MRLEPEEERTSSSAPKHVPHKGHDIAYHIDWGFRREALIWDGDRPVGANLHPLGGELRAWMRQEGKLQVFLAGSKGCSKYSNGYTYDASVLSSLFALALNDAHAFSQESGPIDSLDAELQRVRMYSEQVLYIARTCEALIKQLLYCVAIPPGYYKGSALGRLLSKDCPGCRESSRQPHKLSLLGSLAHRYHLCLPFEECLFKHTQIVNRRRDVEAAHTGVCKIGPTTAAESRRRLTKDSIAIGEEFAHMLQHISDLEREMLGELRAAVAAGTAGNL